MLPLLLLVANVGHEAQRRHAHVPVASHSVALRIAACEMARGCIESNKTENQCSAGPWGRIHHTHLEHSEDKTRQKTFKTYNGYPDDANCYTKARVEQTCTPTSGEILTHSGRCRSAALRRPVRNRNRAVQSSCRSRLPTSMRTRIGRRHIWTHSVRHGHMVGGWVVKYFGCNRGA